MQRESALIVMAALAASYGYCQSSPPPQSGTPPDEIGILKVQGNVYMVVTPAGNIAAQVGDDGILVVNTGPEAMAPKIAAALRKLSDKPIQWVVNTDADPDHFGGNEALPGLSGLAPGRQPRIVAHENVLNRLSAAPARNQTKTPESLWPNDEYFTPIKDFSFNGEAVLVYHVPDAITDGDSMVHFRRSDVLAAGAVFTPGLYPVIHLDRGGSIQGLIALNQILRITVPLKYEEAGTYVIPGRGRLCDEADVVEYRNMVTIVRDRVRDLIGKDKTLEQVKTARPTRDYDTQYDAQSADAFVEAVYKSLTGKK